MSPTSGAPGRGWRRDTFPRARRRSAKATSSSPSASRCPITWPAGRSRSAPARAGSRTSPTVDGEPLRGGGRLVQAVDRSQEAATLRAAVHLIFTSRRPSTWFGAAPGSRGAGLRPPACLRPGAVPHRGPGRRPAHRPLRRQLLRPSRSGALDRGPPRLAARDPDALDDVHVGWSEASRRVYRPALRPACLTTCFIRPAPGSVRAGPGAHAWLRPAPRDRCPRRAECLPALEARRVPRCPAAVRRPHATGHRGDLTLRLGGLHADPADPEACATALAAGLKTARWEPADREWGDPRRRSRGSKAGRRGGRVRRTGPPGGRAQR